MIFRLKRWLGFYPQFDITEHDRELAREYRALARELREEFIPEPRPGSGLIVLRPPEGFVAELAFRRYARRSGEVVVDVAA